jgi:hypothetical protein
MIYRRREEYIRFKLDIFKCLKVFKFTKLFQLSISEIFGDFDIFSILKCVNFSKFEFYINWSEHKWSEPGHDILFQEANIIAKENRYYPQLIRDEIEIAKNPENVHRDKSYHLHNAWKRVLRKLTN